MFFLLQNNKFCIFLLEITKQSFVFVIVSIDSHQLHQDHVNKLNIDGCFDVAKMLTFFCNVSCVPKHIRHISIPQPYSLIDCIVYLK